MTKTTPPSSLSSASNKPDKITKRGLQDSLNNEPAYLQAKIAQEEATTKKLQEEIETIKQDRNARKIFGYGIFIFVCSYILIVLGIIVFKNTLPRDVAKILLGTTSVNIIGLLTVVVRYLFPNKK